MNSGAVIPILQGQAQDEFATCLANPLVKAGHEAGVNGQCMATVLLAAEELPVGALHSVGHHFFIRDVAGVFEQLQSRLNMKCCERTGSI
jgi:hypothetical protein